MENSILYLSRQDVERVGLGMARIIELLEEVFLEKENGAVELPPKIGIHTQPDAFLHAMPAYIPRLGHAGMKWVGAYPENHKFGLPYITGLMILNDTATGLPVAIMDSTWITAYRTGGATALSARYLARPESSRVGVMGCGVEGRTNLIGLAALFPVDKVFAYDISAEAQQRYIREMSDLLGVEVVGVDYPRQVMADSDMVITAGPIMRHPKPTIDADWLKPGLFASSVDFGSYWSPDSLRKFDKFISDDLEQHLYYRKVGYFDGCPDPHSDLGKLISGKSPGRESPEECTMAMNLGSALSDLAIAPEIYLHAREMGLGTILPL